MTTSSSRAARRRGASRSVAAIAALALIAAACGSDDDEAEPADTTADTTAETAADTTAETTADTTADTTGDDTDAGPADGDPVTIGVISDETGPSQSRAINVLQATVDDINENGGLAGHPIELQHTDAGSDVAKSQTAVSELSDDVVAVFLSTPATEAAVADSLSELGVPILGVGYNPTVWGGEISIFGLLCSEDNPDNCSNENFFATAPTVEQTIAMQLLGAQAAGASKVTSAPCVEVDSCSASIPIFDGIAESLGLEVSPAVPISTTAADYSAECIEFIQNGVDFVQVSASAVAAVNLTASCRDQGYEGTFGASAGSVDQQVVEIPSEFAGGLNGFPWFVDDEPVVEYRELMETAGVPIEDWGYSHGTALYAAIRLLETAINGSVDAGAPLDGAAALEAMYSLDGETLDGLLANPASFSPDDLNRTNQCFWSYLKDAEGKMENPNGGLTTACYPSE